MTVKTIKKIENMPFFCGVRESPLRKSTIPDNLPFSLGVSSPGGLIVQVPDHRVLDALRRSYEEEDVFLTSPMDESPMTCWRGEECIDVLCNSAKYSIRGKRLLEIGCSTGYLLNEFRKRGAIVRGCEPGPSALIARERYGLEVDNDFFRPGLYQEGYDIVILFTVLEHVVDPVDFLSQVVRILKPGGRIFLGVPDCEAELTTGDPGMLLHEHWSYFTLPSLTRLLRSTGFADVHCFRTPKGTLYGWGTLSDDNSPPNEISDSPRDPDMANNYVNKLEKTIRNMDRWLSRAREKGERIGFYGASGGAANLLSFINWHDMSLTIYDTDPLKHGKYLPDCELEIRSPGDLLNDMPDCILILPVNFAESIRTYLKNDLKIPQNVTILTLEDVMNGKIS